MGLMDCIKGSYTMMQKQYRLGLIRENYRNYARYIEKAGGKVSKLTPRQKQQVDDIYKKYGFKYSYRTHEMYQAVTGEFDPYIFPEDLFRTTVEYVLNNQGMRAAYIDKCYFDRIVPGLPYPECICKNVNGIFYDRDFNLLKKNDVLHMLNTFDRFVIKPSLETGLGRGVKLVQRTDDVERILCEYDKNYILQEVVVQHRFFSSLNKSSVNVMRVNTLFLGDEVHVLSATIRVGVKGSFTDMSSTDDGHGMLLIGIDEAGVTREKAYYQNGQCEVMSRDGVVFAGEKIPSWEKILRIVKEGHRQLGHFAFIGWDIAVNENEEPVVIEYNVSGPGVLYYQYTNGPLLGNHTQEVMEYVVKNVK